MGKVLRFLILLPLLAPAWLSAQAIDFPRAPVGQVLDTGRWLGDERRTRLEEELGRYREQYQIDVVVVLWDRSLPPETSLEELAERIGETWSRESIWAVVLHIPHSLHRPAIVAGGSGMKILRSEAIGDALHNAEMRGNKERTTRAQVEALGLETGEELVFLKHRSILEHKAFLALQDQQARDAEQQHQTMIFRAVIVTLLALVSVATVAFLYRFKRLPKNLEFPETRWRKRLGARWSGGGHIVVSFPSPAQPS